MQEALGEALGIPRRDQQLCVPGKLEHGYLQAQGLGAVGLLPEIVQYTAAMVQISTGHGHGSVQKQHPEARPGGLLRA
jgi:hypothetical protein